MPESLLQTVLALLDQLESPVISHTSIAAHPPDAVAQLMSEGILRETSNADVIPRPELLRPGPDLNVRATPRGLFGVADEGDYFDPVPLTEEDDARQYEVSLPQLVEKVRRENGIDGNGFRNDSGLFPVGRKFLDGTGVLDVYLSLPNDSEDALLARCRRLMTAGSQTKVVLLTPRGLTLSTENRQMLESGGIATLSLMSVAAHGNLAVDWNAAFGTGGSSQAKSKQRGDVRRFPTPPGSTWSDLEMRFIDGHVLSVKIGDQKAVLNYAQMDMANRKNANPTVQWKLLQDMAEGRGILNWKSPAADRKNQKRIENLGKNLKAFFQIGDSPFHVYQPSVGWRAKFVISPER